MLDRQPLDENFAFFDLTRAADNCHAELLDGLCRSKKFIAAKYFYDDRGSTLFEQITREPEYYPTRTEMAILADQGAAIAARIGPQATLIEPGSGNSDKARLLLPKLNARSYVPMDISRQHLYQASRDIARDFPSLQVAAVCADYTSATALPAIVPQHKRVIFYPGSTIGNFEPAAAQAFLTRLRRWAGADGALLVGVDLDKQTHLLDAAYNDANGTTAAFNLNILHNVNGVLDANFDPDNFAHKAFYNRQQQRVEMHLLSLREQYVDFDKGTLALLKGETIRTEYSYKYSPEGFAALARRAGFSVTDAWQDEQGWFGVCYLNAV